MAIFLAALFPVLVLIMVGYGLKRSAFMPESAWAGLEKLTYYVLFPALLLKSLAGKDLTGIVWPEILLVVTVTLLVAAAGTILLRLLSPSCSDATFTSVFQGSVRFNTFIVLAVAEGLYGSEGLAIASLTTGFLIVQVNLLCIFAFGHWGELRSQNSAALIRQVFTNPLILACLTGWGLNISNISLLPLINDSLAILGNAALPLGLLAVGAALKPTELGRQLRPVALASVVQFGLKPLTAVLLIQSLGLDGISAGVLLIAFTCPTAPSAYILAQQLGGDSQVMAAIITLQTLLAFLVMPLLGLYLF